MVGILLAEKALLKSTYVNRDTIKQDTHFLKVAKQSLCPNI
jgi:hypothetical protein